jgi:hypothetical protein
MEEITSVPQRIIEVLQQIRSNARKILVKQQELEDVDTGIESDRTKIKTLLDECESLDGSIELDGKLEDVKKIGSQLTQLENQRTRLSEELRNHNSDLLYFRERLEDELWHALVETGQVQVEDEEIDIVPSPQNASMGGSDISCYNHRGHMIGSSDLNIDAAYATGQVPAAENEQIQNARSLLGAAKENLQDAVMAFDQLDQLCAAQRREFETRIIPEWRDMTRTEFDLQQLAHKIELSRQLVQAERAYSEAGRFAMEVGFVREDAEQSCHFLDEPNDGTYSGDRYEATVEDKDDGFIEQWRKNVGLACSTSPASAKSDVWEVDSVKFGEGYSTHGDEWNKIRIDQWEGLRDMERVKIQDGSFASPDELVCQHMPLAAPTSTPRGEGIDTSRPGLWKPSFASIKGMVTSGRAAVVKYSEGWSIR